MKKIRYSKLCPHCNKELKLTLGIVEEEPTCFEDLSYPNLNEERVRKNFERWMKKQFPKEEEFDMDNVATYDYITKKWNKEGK